MHVLITGGAGYIGSHLCPLLLAAGHRVTVIDRFYFGSETLRPLEAKHPGKLRLIRGDVRDPAPADYQGVDAAILLAGISNDPACDLDPAITRGINLDGAVQAARLVHAGGARKVIFASSCSVYGFGSAVGLTEDAEPAPVSLYAQLKLEGERQLFALGRELGLEVTALRFATVFGLSRRMRFDLAVNVMTKNAYVARKIVVEGGGRQWRPFVHVRDVARAFELVLDAPSDHVAGRVFNIGSTAQNSRIINLAYRVRDIIPGTEIVLAPTDVDRRDYNVSFDRAHRELEFRPQHSIEEGIAEILEALRLGTLDPDDRRWYTLKHYTFLAEVERAYRELALEGRVLG